MNVEVFGRLFQSLRQVLRCACNGRDLRPNMVARDEDARAAGKAVIQRRRRLMERLSK